MHALDETLGLLYETIIATVCFFHASGLCYGASLRVVEYEAKSGEIYECKSAGYSKYEDFPS